MKAQIQYGELTLSITYKAAEEGIEITGAESQEGTEMTEFLNCISDRYAAFLDKQVERRIGVWHEIERLTMASIEEKHTERRIDAFADRMGLSAVIGSAP
ncbi:MAG TPA: hypothetical protein VFM10_01645 [Terriglobales bacterium]|nr:hypothetical protein [Terriglobales bacterium]